MTSEPEHLAQVFREVCEQEVVDDGLRFPVEPIRAEPIRDDQADGGVRVRLIALLDRARIPLQVDIGFGDAPVPPPRQVEWPGLLDFPRPRVKVYPREAVVSEKLQAMIQLGIANSRMKDFYDIWWMSSRFAFQGEALVRSMRATFERRWTDVPRSAPLALQEAFFHDEMKTIQWNAFVRKGRLVEAPPPFSKLGELLRGFLRPVFEAASTGTPIPMEWPPGGPWQSA